MKTEELVTYCGVYAGTCARWHTSGQFRTLAAMLAELADAHGFQHWMPGSVKEFDYTEFRKGLEFLSRDDTWLVCRTCCKGGDGHDCRIRNCCRERGVDLCFDCEEFPCDLVRDHTQLMDRSREYRRFGKSEWLRQQVKRAAQGFEHHTGKFYECRASTSVPEVRGEDKS